MLFGATVSSANSDPGVFRVAAVMAPGNASDVFEGLVRMCRSNLFRMFAVIGLIVSGALPAVGQYYGGHQSVPGIHIPQSGYQAPIVDYYVGQPPELWDGEQPVERFLTEIARRSWFRVDYMHLNFEDPGSLNIGAPVLNVPTPLTVADNLNQAGVAPGNPTGVAEIPTYGPLSPTDVPGIRGTWGLDLANADLEVQFFGTDKKHESFSRTNLQAFRDAAIAPLNEGTLARPNIAIPLLTDGVVTDAGTANFLIFDDSFSATLENSMWGGEVTLLSDPYLPGGEGAAWQWLGGFRYLQFEEEFSLAGTFNNGGAGAGVTTRIGGSTSNNMYGPEVGARASLNHRWFSLSATPRVAFALNDYNSQTTAGPLISAADPTTTSKNGDVDFTPIVQLGLQGEIYLTPHFSVFGGYGFLWMYRVTRPHQNIVYDSQIPVAGGAGTPVPVITHKTDFEPLYTKGLSFGFVFRY